MRDPTKQYFVKLTASAFPEQSETAIVATVSVFVLEQAAVAGIVDESGLPKYHPSAALSKPSSSGSVPVSLKYKASIDQTFPRLSVLINNKTKKLVIVLLLAAVLSRDNNYLDIFIKFSGFQLMKIF